MGKEITPTLVSGQYKMSGNTQYGLSVITYRKKGHPQNSEQGQGYEETMINDTLNIYDNTETRTPTLVCERKVYDWRRLNARVTELKDVCVTAMANWGGGGNNMPYVLEQDMERVVRRLTPLECERLQGFPDDWTNIGEWVDSKGKKHKEADSPRYKALGNSIALPFWEWMAERMIKVLKDDGVDNPKMASLFDGIGGFPLVYSRHGCEPVWASEIEEFPIAVTKLRFKEKEKEE